MRLSRGSQERASRTKMVGAKRRTKTMRDRRDIVANSDKESSMESSSDSDSSMRVKDDLHVNYDQSDDSSGFSSSEADNDSDGDLESILTMPSDKILQYFL